jgi:hypothetical protein
MARTPTPDVKITEALQPSAGLSGAPFAHPATPAPSPLRDVASALEGLGGELAGWAAKEKQKTDEAEFLRGQVAGITANPEGWAEGVRTGEIPADKSPHFVQGYKQAVGAAAGFNLESYVGGKWDEWDGKNNSDPAAFDNWFRNTVREKVGSTDPYVLKGLVPHLNEIHNKYHDRWQKTQTVNAEYQAQSAFGALVGSKIDDAQSDADQDGYTLDAAALGPTIDTIRKSGFSIGLRSEQIDKAVTDAVTSKALEHRDAGLLDLLDRESAAGPKLSDTPYGRDEKLKAQDSITKLWKATETEARLKQEREDRLAANQGKASIVEQLLKDPDAPLDEAQIAKVTKVDGDFKLDIIKWRDAIRNNQVNDDPKAVSQLYSDILAGGDGMEKLMGAIRSGAVRSKDNIAQAMSFMKSVQEYAQKPGGILETAAASSYIKQMTTMGMDSAFKENRILGDAPVLTEAGRNALNGYRLGMMQWQAANPNASPMDKEQEATRLGEIFVKSFGAPMPAQDRAFTRPAESAAPPPGAFPLTDALTKMEEQAKAAGLYPPPEVLAEIDRRVKERGLSRTEAIKTMLNESIQRDRWQQTQERLRTSATPPDINSFSPEVRAAIEARSRDLPGTTPQGVVNGLWRNLRSNGSPIAPDAKTNGPRSDLSPIELPGGLGQVHLTNVQPDAVDAIRQAIGNMGIGGIINPTTASLAFASEDQPREHATPVSTLRVQNIARSPVGPAVQSVAQQEGFDPDKLAAIVSIESGGNPNASTGSYHGLLQLSQAEFSKYGRGGNIMDPEANLIAGVRSLKDKEQRFAREFGREPSATELYLMHQQGEAGLRSHERNLDAPAWRNMLNTGEGRQKGERWAKLAVWGNVPTDMRARFGSVDRMTSRQFLAVWTSKLLGVGYEQALAMNSGGDEDQRGHSSSNLQV